MTGLEVAADAQGACQLETDGVLITLQYRSEANDVVIFAPVTDSEANGELTPAQCKKALALVDAVKASLLTAAGQTGNATLDTDIKAVDLKSMVKGSVIKDIAGRFSTANSETILKYDAAKVAKSVGKQVAAKLSTRMFGIGKTDVVGSIVAHALKPMIDDPARLPMKETRDAGGSVKTVLDKNLLEAQLTAAAADAEKLVKSIANDQRLGCPNIDQNYAKHIIATLFNPAAPTGCATLRWGR